MDLVIKTRDLNLIHRIFVLILINTKLLRLSNDINIFRCFRTTLKFDNLLHVFFCVIFKILSIAVIILFLNKIMFLLYQITRRIDLNIFIKLNSVIGLALSIDRFRDGTVYWGIEKVNLDIWIRMWDLNDFIDFFIQFNSVIFHHYLPLILLLHFTRM